MSETQIRLLLIKVYSKVVREYFYISFHIKMSVFAI